MPQLTKNLESTGADSRTEVRILHRGIHPCSLRQRYENIARQRRDDGQNKNRDGGHVLPVDIVFNLTDRLGHSVLPLTVESHSLATSRVSEFSEKDETCPSQALLRANRSCLAVSPGDLSSNFVS